MRVINLFPQKLKISKYIRMFSPGCHNVTPCCFAYLFQNLRYHIHLLYACVIFSVFLQERIKIKLWLILFYSLIFVIIPLIKVVFRKRAMKNVTSKHETKENIEMTQNVSLKRVYKRHDSTIKSFVWLNMNFISMFLILKTDHLSLKSDMRISKHIINVKHF